MNEKQQKELFDFLQNNVDFPATGQQVIDFWRESHREETEISNHLINDLNPAQEYEFPSQIIDEIKKETQPIV